MYQNDSTQGGHVNSTKPESYKQQILSSLFSYPGLSRADLADLLQVDRATVTRLCKELLEELEIQPGDRQVGDDDQSVQQDDQSVHQFNQALGNLGFSTSADLADTDLTDLTDVDLTDAAEPVLEYAPQPGTRTTETSARVALGRRREPLKLHEGKRCFVVLEVQFNLIRSGLVSPYGDVFWDNASDYPGAPEDSTELMTRIISITKQAVMKAQILDRIPGGIGIGLSGLVDPKTGSLVHSKHLGVTQDPLPISQLLYEEFGIPCAIDNDAKCCCYDVMTFGTFQDKKHFLYVLGDLEPDAKDQGRYTRVGVGTALVLNGQVVYGNNGYAGEFRSIYAQPSVFGQLGWEDNLEPFLIRSDNNLRQRFLKELSKQVVFLMHYLDLEAVYFGGGIESLKADLEPRLATDLEHLWLYRDRVNKSVHLHFAPDQSKPVLRGAGALIARSRYGA